MTQQMGSMQLEYCMCLHCLVTMFTCRYVMYTCYNLILENVCSNFINCSIFLYKIKILTIALIITNTTKISMG